MHDVSLMDVARQHLNSKRPRQGCSAGTLNITLAQSSSCHGEHCWQRMIDNRTGKMWDKGYVNCYEAVSPLEKDQRVGMSAARINAIARHSIAPAIIRRACAAAYQHSDTSTLTGVSRHVCIEAVPFPISGTYAKTIERRHWSSDTLAASDDMGQGPSRLTSIVDENSHSVTNAGV